VPDAPGDITLVRGANECSFCNRGFDRPRGSIPSRCSRAIRGGLEQDGGGMRPPERTGGSFISLTIEGNTRGRSSRPPRITRRMRRGYETGIDRCGLDLGENRSPGDEPKRLGGVFSAKSSPSPPGVNDWFSRIGRQTPKGLSLPQEKDGRAGLEVGRRRNGFAAPIPESDGGIRSLRSRLHEHPWGSGRGAMSGRVEANDRLRGVYAQAPWGRLHLGLRDQRRQGLVFARGRSLNAKKGESGTCSWGL